MTTWNELRALKVGDWVRFSDDWDVFPHTIVPAGTVAMVREQALARFEHPMLVVLPDSEQVRSDLAEWEGNVHLTPYDSGTSNQGDDAAPVDIIPDPLRD